MSFQRNRQKDAQWRRWVKQHHEALLAISIPREVWESARDWETFLYEGCFPDPVHAHNVRFRLEDLNDEQQRLLFQFLEASLPEASRGGPTVWAVLNRRFCHSPLPNDA